MTEQIEMTEEGRTGTLTLERTKTWPYWFLATVEWSDGTKESMPILSFDVDRLRAPADERKMRRLEDAARGTVSGDAQESDRR